MLQVPDDLYILLCTTALFSFTMHAVYCFDLDLTLGIRSGSIEQFFATVPPCAVFASLGSIDQRALHRIRKLPPFSCHLVCRHLSHISLKVIADIRERSNQQADDIRVWRRVGRRGEVVDGVFADV